MIKNFDYNYHTHTKRCHHATGEDEEYILCAIENGVKHLGFSDHLPFLSKDGKSSLFRVAYSQGQEYYDTINALREKYKDKIDILIGFESEYYPNDFGVMLETARKFKGEYLILGEHFCSSEYDGGKYTYASEFNDSELKNYVDVLIAGMETGYFSYLAHPDIINFFPNEVYQREMARLCLASKKLNIPIEVNLLGVRENRHYPNPAFWKVAGGIGAPVVVGCDAHKPCDVYNQDCITKAFDMIEEFDLNYIGRPKIIRIDK